MKKLFSMIAAALLALFGLSAQAQELTVRFFDMGKADAMLITTPSGEQILIDAGTNKGGKKLAERFAKDGVDAIDLMIITHFDKDHVGGADKVLESVPVARVVMPKYAKESKQHTQFMDALSQSPKTQVDVLSAKGEKTFEFGGMILRITAAQETDYGIDEENDFSLAAYLTYGETKFLFTGDAEDARQTELLRAGDIACDVLKVPYHGRAVDVSAAFLSACHPKIAFITDSDDDPADPIVVTRFPAEPLRAALSPLCGQKGDLWIPKNKS